jgi:predicted  nucleic acid-binding Zn-ribbon protein
MPVDFVLFGRRGCGGGLQVNPDLRNLILLQDIDQKIVSLRKQISDIPEKINAFRAELQQLEQAHQIKIQAHQEYGRQRRTREGEVEMMRTKLSRFKEQLMSVKTNKEYTAMLHEIQGAEGQIRIAEDGILEIMDQMEMMEAALGGEERDLKARQSELEAQIRSAEKSIPALESEVARLVEERSAFEAQITPDMLARYRRIADARRGIALAEAKNELCSACHVRIRPQVIAELLRSREIHVCDSCSRILFVRENG